MGIKRKHETLITVDKNGNGTMHNRRLFEEFCRMHPNSHIYATFVKKTKSHTSSTLKYYWAEVVTKMQMGLRSAGYQMDKDATHEFCKQFSPVMYDEIFVGDQLIKHYKSVRDLSQEEFGEYIEDLKRLAAQEFSLIINDPE